MKITVSSNKYIRDITDVSRNYDKSGLEGEDDSDSGMDIGKMYDNFSPEDNKLNRAKNAIERANKRDFTKAGTISQ